MSDWASPVRPDGDEPPLKTDVDDKLPTLENVTLEDSSHYNDRKEPDTSNVASGHSASAPEVPSITEGSEADKGDSYYSVKWVTFQDDNLPIVMQNDNGPCPLIAIANVLLLRKTIRIAPNTEIVTVGQLISHISEYLINAAPKNMNEGETMNYQQNLHDAFLTFPQLQTGLDVNVGFTSVSSFEYTSALCIFDSLIINLFHGWLVDPGHAEIAEAVGESTYNQLVEKIISSKSDDSSPQKRQEGMLAEAFLEHSASQLTLYGLFQLAATLQDNQLAVLFRNNHFSTIYKRKDRILLLVTDISLLHEAGIVWEMLNDVDGDTQFVNSCFEIYEPSPAKDSPTAEATGSRVPNTLQSDYELALSLQQEQRDFLVSDPDEDLLLARQMQDEEDRQAAADNAPTDRVQGGDNPIPPVGARRQNSRPQTTAHGDQASQQEEADKESKGSVSRLCCTN